MGGGGLIHFCVLLICGQPAIWTFAFSDGQGSISNGRGGGSGGMPVVVNVDCSTAPKLAIWCNQNLILASQNYYQLAVNYIDPSGSFASSEIYVKMDGNCQGYISHGGNRYYACANDLPAEPSTDQMNRIMQMYPYSAINMNTNSPAWFQDCAVAYIRWYRYEPASRHPDKPVRDSGPKTTSDNGCSYWLNYVIENHSNGSSLDVLQQIVALAQQKGYSDDLWKEITGKTVDQLWKDMKAAS